LKIFHFLRFLDRLDGSTIRNEKDIGGGSTIGQSTP
jgi:hypothetical protein